MTAHSFLRDDATMAQVDDGDITGGAWTSYSPTITPGSGSFTTTSSNCATKTIGKTVFWRGRISITTVGTAAGGFFITLPGGMTLNTGSGCCGCARETTAGLLWQVFAVDGGATTLTFFRYDNNTTLSSGMDFKGSAVFEIQ